MPAAILAGLLALLLSGRAAQAYTIPDPKRAMRWEEMLACDLIIVARHESHEAETLSLKVARVLGRLESNSLVVRQGGQEVLAGALHAYFQDRRLTGRSRPVPQ